MTAVNKEVCKSLIAKKRWSETCCLLCSVRKRSQCENLKAIREAEDREYEETHAKFQERMTNGEVNEPVSVQTSR